MGEKNKLWKMTIISNNRNSTVYKFIGRLEDKKRLFVVIKNLKFKKHEAVINETSKQHQKSATDTETIFPSNLPAQFGC